MIDINLIGDYVVIAFAAVALIAFIVLIVYLLHDMIEYW
jgi:hypothetical protein